MNKIKDQPFMLKNFKKKYLIFGLVLFLIIIFKLNENFNYNDEIENDRKNLFETRENFNDDADLVNLNELFYVGDCLLRLAASRIVKIRLDNNEFRYDRKKVDNSIVTSADLESHNIIVLSLKEKFKNLNVKSEESNSNEYFDPSTYLDVCDSYVKRQSDRYALKADIIVYIDPLDATQEYSENLVDYVTVMFCIVDKGMPRAGIIHKAFSNETITSFYQNLKLKRPMKLSRKKRVIVSRSHAGSVKSIINEKINDAEIITAAGSGYKTTQLLRNEADVYLHSTLIKRWDICAPNAILNNLGGKLTKRNGQSIDYSDHVKSNVVDGIIASLYDYDYFFDIFKKN